jgi:hypothetical protein
LLLFSLIISKGELNDFLVFIYLLTGTFIASFISGSLAEYLHKKRK